MNIYIYLIMAFILFCMSWSDLRDKTIPHTLTILLLIVGIINGCINDNFKTINWILFGIFVVLFVITFYIFDKMNKPIGGGDIKMLCITFLFLTDYSQYMTYCICSILVNLFGIIYITFTIPKRVRTATIKFGPFLSLALFITTTLFVIPAITNCITIICLYTIGLLVLDYYYFSKEVAQNYELDKE